VLLASTRALWYLTRATGLVSLVLLTLSVVLGITEAVRWAHPHWPRLITAGLHKNVSLLVLAFLAVHIVTAVTDSFAPIRWMDVIVPFASAYRPIWMGLGAVAVDLLVALTVTSLLRQRLGYQVWRAVHWAAYACWPVALLHGLGTGSDPRVGWALALQAASLAMVAGAVAWRLATGWNAEDHRRVAGAIGSAVAVVGIVGFTLAGPVRTGWARRAGTPTSLLASSRAATTGASRPATTPTYAGASSTSPASSTPNPGAAESITASGLTAPFTSSLHGLVTQTAPSAAGNTTVTIAASLGGGATGRLAVILHGQALANGGVEMQSSSATLGPLGRPNQYEGQVVSLSGSRLIAVLQDAQGRRIELLLSLQIDEGSGGVSGTAVARPIAAAGDDDAGGGQ
jgi:Ferric reductase like transmembrane component